MKKMLFALSLSGALLGGSVAWAEEAATAPTPSEQVTVVETTDVAAPAVQAVEAVAAPVEAPAPAEEEPTLDTGDTAWILVSTALVLLMVKVTTFLTISLRHYFYNFIHLKKSDDCYESKSKPSQY